MQITRESKMKGYNCTYLGKLCWGCLSQGFLGHRYKGSTLPGSSEPNPDLLSLWHWVEECEAVAKSKRSTQFLQKQMACGRLITGPGGSASWAKSSLRHGTNERCELCIGTRCLRDSTFQFVSMTFRQFFTNNVGPVVREETAAAFGEPLGLFQAEGCLALPTCLPFSTVAVTMRSEATRG